jgi:Zn-finger nucleic acid-binding protein
MGIFNKVHGSEFCPACKVSLKSEDIYEYFLNKYKDKGRALESAKMYGWTPENKVCFGRAIGIETSQYDGVTWYQCPDCKAIWKRFEWSSKRYL